MGYQASLQDKFDHINLKQNISLVSELLPFPGSSCCAMKENHENSTSIPAKFTVSSRRDTPCGGKPPLAVVSRACARQVQLCSSVIKEATSDVVALERVAFENPGCNWALFAGPASGVFAVKADDQSGAASFLSITYRYEAEKDWNETLESAVLGIPDCAFFQWPEGMILRNADRRIASGLSIRADGDWVLIPPSTNVAGAKYIFRDPETPPAPAPKWIIKKFFVAQNEQSRSNILPFPRLPEERATSAFRSVRPASRIILPFLSMCAQLPAQTLVTASK